MSKKLSNFDIDKRLLGRSVQRIGNYIDYHTKIKFLCLVDSCNYIWESTPSNILFNRGCPKCVGRVCLTNEIVDQRLILFNIKRLETVINSATKIKFSCNICSHIWKTTPNHILNAKTGCPACSKVLPLTNEIVDHKLNNRNIKRLTDYTGIDNIMHFQCLQCDYGLNLEWATSPNNILNGEKGCPICKIGKNEKIVAAMLTDANIIFERQKPIKNLFDIDRNYRVDFYIPMCNSIIEYNGQQHYEPVCFGNMSSDTAQQRFQIQKERDLFVEKFCNMNKICIFWIDGRKYTNSLLKIYLITQIIPKLANIC